MSTKRSFIIHVDSLSVLKKLKDEQAGKLFKAIALFQEDELLPEDDFISIVFEPFLNQFLRDSEKYQNIVERNKLNGSKGGRPKNPMGYLETQSNPKEPKKADSGIDNGNGIDSRSESKISNVDEECKSKSKSESKRFSHPTLEEVKNYCQERNNTVNPEKWISHYQSNGWKVGKNQMKDWKAGVRTWEGNSFESKPTQFANKEVQRQQNNIEASKKFLQITGGDDAF